MKLIITNGDSAASRISGFDSAAKIVPWRDVLHDGPVLKCQNLDEQSESRARFIADFANMDLASVLADFKARDAVLNNAAAYEKVELWFEHDLYDQLQLLQIVDHLNRHMPEQEVHLVQAEDFLCEISEDSFQTLPNCAVAVSDEQKRFASNLWQAFTNPEPHALIRFADEEAPLPFVPSAIKRLLAEFPDKKTGLPVSLYNALTLLHEGAATIGRLFRHMQEKEDAKFMGDLSFAHLLDGVAHAPSPLLLGSRGTLEKAGEGDAAAYFGQQVELSPVGKEVMAGWVNHVRINGINRWIGGVHLRDTEGYFYDRTIDQIVALSGGAD